MNTVLLLLRSVWAQLTWARLAWACLLAVSAFPAWAADDRWRPVPNSYFDWQLTEPFAFARATDVLDLDLFDADAKDIRALKARGIRLVCYINVGAWEDWRDDAQDFPPHVLGQAYEGWAGERWLDIRDIDALAPVLKARFDLCRAKGFDAIEPDNIDGYDTDTGFPITRAEQVRFNLWLARQAHDRGLSIALKNAPDLLPQLADVYDWALTEDCFVQIWCASLAPLVAAGKAVFAVEYTDQSLNWPDTCARAKALGISVILKNRALDGWLKRCN